MWSPTHVQVTVQKAKGLLTKGKNGTNDAFVTIALGKEKYQTSVKEKATKEVEWHEECELQIPIQGNTAEIVLTALHRNFLGVDEFLGAVNIPLADFDVYERPKNRWYGLKSKPGKEKNKPRGELEVKVAFIVKAGSLVDLSKKEKHKSSLGQLSHMAHSVGGSLLSIGTMEKRKGLKKLAKSIGNKMSKKNHKDDDSKPGSPEMVQGGNLQASRQVAGDADPGVVSDGESEDDFTFDDLSHKSSGSSLNTHQVPATPPPKIGSLENLAGEEVLRHTATLPSTVTTPPMKPPRSGLPAQGGVDEWEQKLYGKQGKEALTSDQGTLKRRSWESSKTFLTSQPEEEEPMEAGTNVGLVTSSSNPSFHNSPILEAHHEPERKEESKLAKKFKNFRKGKEPKVAEVAPQAGERMVMGSDIEGVRSVHGMRTTRLTPDILHKFEGKSREDLIELVCNMQSAIEGQTKKMKDLEDYLDNLLLRVMETTPRILQNPFITCKTQAKIG